MSLIGEAAKDVKEIDATFSVNDLIVLLNKICVHMAGEFEIHQTPSRYIQIVYAPDVLDEVGFDEGHMVSDFVDTQDRERNTLWISEKVVIAFINRNLYGIASMLYFLPRIPYDARRCFWDFRTISPLNKSSRVVTSFQKVGV